MQENQLKALIQLISKEDSSYSDVLKGDLSHALKSHPAKIADILNNDFKGVLPPLLSEMMEDAAWEHLTEELHAFNGKINPDLEEGLYLVSKFLNPTLSRETLDCAMHNLAFSLRKPLFNCADCYEVAQMMQAVFFKHLGFNVSAKPRPSEISFASFLDKKTGSSLCAASLYAVTGKRFNIDVNIVDIAGRILVQFNDDAFEKPFYADPLDSGKIISEEQCREYIEHRGLEWREGNFEALSSRALTRRFFANLIFVYNKLKDERRLSYLRNFLTILDN